MNGIEQILILRKQRDKYIVGSKPYNKIQKQINQIELALAAQQATPETPETPNKGNDNPETP